MDSINKLYGKRLKDLRVKRKLTQEHIANSIDIRTATISDFENGKISIKLDTLICICNILGVTLKEFFDFDSLPVNAQKESIIANINTNIKTLDDEKLLYINKIVLMFNNIE